MPMVLWAVLTFMVVGELAPRVVTGPAAAFVYLAVALALWLAFAASSPALWSTP